MNEARGQSVGNHENFSDSLMNVYANLFLNDIFTSILNYANFYI